MCLFEGLNDLRLVYNDCEKIYFITFVKVGVAIYNDHIVLAYEHGAMILIASIAILLSVCELKNLTMGLGQ